MRLTRRGRLVLWMLGATVAYKLITLPPLWWMAATEIGRMVRGG